ncbi:type II secretion system protein GspM [Parasphingorhabdus sp. JC815]|uniref:type II secretion system protein GspM n=1 Tax=Parasphingorhabdus sp. JC815 TaxID=3232140 RepID=UPI003458CD66
MIATIKDRFLGLSQREQILIGVLGFLIALILGYYALIAPFLGAYESAQNRYTQAIDRQTQIEAKVAALTAPLNTAIKPVDGPLDIFIGQNAGEAGFAVGRLDPQNDGTILLAIDSANPTALFGWLSALESRGVSVAELTVNPGANQTVTATIILQPVELE